MKNENQNQNETIRKNWTDEKIINCIVGWNLEAEKIAEELDRIEANIAIVEATVCTSPHLVVQNMNKKIVPLDKMIDLVLHSITLKEEASILKVKIAHAEKNIKFFRGIIDG